MNLFRIFTPCFVAERNTSYWHVSKRSADLSYTMPILRPGTRRHLIDFLHVLGLRCGNKVEPQLAYDIVNGYLLET
jgi:hypothetical protein